MSSHDATWGSNASGSGSPEHSLTGFVRGVLGVPGAKSALAVAAVAWLIVIAELAFFAVRQPIWSPIDEYNHFFYVNYLYYAHRPPIVGMLYFATTDPSAPAARSIPPSYGRGVAMPPINPSSEAIQPPGYYVLMLLPFATASHLSYDQVIHVRLATAALAMLVVPLTFVIARRAAPSSPWVWGAASVLPAVSRGYTFNLSQVTNDALAALVGGVALLAAIWLLHRRLDWSWGVAAGLITGLAAVTKVTVFFVAIGFALVFVFRLLRDRSWLQGAVAALLAVLIAVAIPVPFLLLNLHRYHALVGSTPFPPNLLPYHNLPLPDALRVMTTLGSVKFWIGELAIASPPLWLVTVGELGLIACAAGVLTALRAQPIHADEGVVLAWTAIGLSYVVILVLSTHVAVLAGRYLYPLFPGLAIVAAVGANRLGRVGRWLFIGAGVALAVLTIIGLEGAFGWVTASCSNCALQPVHP